LAAIAADLRSQPEPNAQLDDAPAAGSLAAPSL